MKKLKISSLYDSLHFIFILIILLILSIKYWYFVFALTIYLFFLFKKTPVFYLGVILSIVTLGVNVKYYITFNDLEFRGIVVECNRKKATILTKKGNVLVYHNNEVSLGDYGKFSVIELDYDTELFNYHEYLENKNIKNYFELNKFEYIDNYFVVGKIRDYFLRLSDENPSKYNSYIKTLLFAYKDDMEILEETQNLGISHLLAVSGMHISILVYLLQLLLRKIFYFEKPIDIIIFAFLLFYLVLCNFEITVFRAVFMVLLGIVFKHLKMQFTKLDILSITGVLLLIFNPRSLFLLSFQLSFIVSFIIIIFAKNFEIKSKILSTYVITFIAFLVTLPFVLNVNYEINLFSILVGPLYVLYFELLLYPITLIMFIFPQIAFIFDRVYSFFEMTIVYFDTIKIFNLVFGEISILSFILYEVLLYFLLVSFEVKRGRTILFTLMFLFIIFLYNKEVFNPFYKIKMYDVGQGDSILIALPHNQGNILIDCYNDVDEYLKKDGIKEIDIIFLSHGHADHINAYEKICDDFKVINTYSSYYDESELLKKLNKTYSIKLLKANDVVYFKEVTFNVLGPVKHYNNENDNSLVLKVLLDDISILFTGDIEKEAEKELVNIYKNELKSDILKVAHHGSSTSSSKLFLEHIKAGYYLISVGRNNKYNFPNNNYLLSLDNVYRTDMNNSITIFKRKKIFYIK